MSGSQGENTIPFSYDGYTGDIETAPKLIVEEDGKFETNYPIKFNLQKPKGVDGQLRDQTGDAARNMLYAHSLGLPELTQRSTPRMGKAIVVGGAPSIAEQLEVIRKFASEPDNWVFAINWSHTWLIQRGIIPKACVLFEIDAEPDTVLKAAHDQVTYYICSHCDRKTFDSLAAYKRVLWHSPPNSDGEKEINQRLFKDSHLVGGGIGTFLRTISIALAAGFRQIELFGCDASFPDDSPSTHVDGYETANKVDTDAFYVWAKPVDPTINPTPPRRFKTVGYLALQMTEFQEYCRINHGHFALRVHGDSLLHYAHRSYFPQQYEP